MPQSQLANRMNVYCMTGRAGSQKTPASSMTLNVLQVNRDKEFCTHDARYAHGNSEWHLSADEALRKAKRPSIVEKPRYLTLVK